MNEHSFSGKWIDDLNQELQGSDRACAILAGALLDERLKMLIQKFLLPASDTKNDKLLGRSAPIESFSSRIEMARRLNLIREETRKSLDWVRDIRNAAAHLEDFSIESNSYRDKIRNLIVELKIEQQAPSILKKPYQGLRGNFIAVIIMLVISLELEEKETKQTEHEPLDVLSKFSVNESKG